MDQTEIRCATYGISDKAFEKMRSILAENGFSLVRFSGAEITAEVESQIGFSWINFKKYNTYSYPTDKLAFCVSNTGHDIFQGKNIKTFKTDRDAALFLCGYFSKNNKNETPAELVKEYGHYRQQFLKVFETLQRNLLCNNDRYPCH